MEELRKSELIAATVLTIAERGFDRTTVRDIARAAGTSPASVLYYFDSKDELLAAAFQETDERFRAGVRRELSALDGIDALVRLVELCFPEQAEQSPQWDIEIDLWALAARRDDFRAIFEAANADWLSILISAFESGIRAGELVVPEDVRESAMAVAALIDGLAIHARVTQHLTAKDARRIVLNELNRLRPPPITGSTGSGGLQ